MRALLTAPFRADGIGAPLRHAVFRRIWLASLCSNLGMLIQGVGAAWLMTEMTNSADMVALVQTSIMLPIMLVALAAGAIADMYDRRVVGLIALSISLSAAVALSVLAMLDMITPYGLLGLCFMVGTGMALFGPAWQASVSEQVPGDVLPSAIALNGISFNIARSFGPAVGGVIVASLGAVAAFMCNALLYIPLLTVLFLWKRTLEPSRLPPEKLQRAIVSGVRYVAHSPSIRTVLARTFLTGMIGSGLIALMPLVARDLLGGDAQIFGVLLGAFGVGSVAGAVNVSMIRRRFSGEAAVRACLVVTGLGISAISLSTNAVLTGALLAVTGAAWTLSITLFNIGVQLSAPRWVAGRTLAAFQASICGGIAIGAWAWGHVANGQGISVTLLICGLTMVGSCLIGLWLTMPTTGEMSTDAADALAEPETRLAVTPRSGPVIIEIEYRVAPAQARAFYRAMQHVQLNRTRNGGYGWSISRDVADPELWLERFHCPTWLDYLRQRSRSTQVERDQQAAAQAFHLGPGQVRVRRLLERPFGSVRWKDETPDYAADEVVPVPAVAAAPGT